MENVFLGIYHFFSKYKLAFWSILITIWVPILFFASQIRLEEDITRVLPGNADSNEYQQVLKQSGMLEKLVVRIALTDTSATDPDRLTAYAADFVSQLQGNGEMQALTKEIRHRIPDDVMRSTYALFYNNLPFFLEEQDYQALDTLINDTNIAQSLHHNYLTLMSPLSLVVKEQIQSDPLHFTARALAKLQSIQINPNFEIYDGYMVSKDRKSLLLLITPANPPSESAHNSRLIAGIDQLIQRLSSGKYKDVQTEYFGASAVAVANSKQIQKDMYLTIILSILSICLLLWGYFRKISLPLTMLLPIAFGASFALAVIYLCKHSISSIAIGGGAIIIGIAVDYSLHVLTHYKHTRSMPEVIRDMTTPLLIGNISTVGAFLSLLFVKSDILFDFGLFAALSLLGAILFTLTFLPQFLSGYAVGPDSEGFAWVERAKVRLSFVRKPYHRFSLLLITVISLVFLFSYRDVTFESDLNALNFMTPELKKAEQHLQTEEEAERSVYMLFKGKDLNEALKRNEKVLGKVDNLIQQQQVSRYFGVTALLPSDSMQQVRKDRWHRYWTPDKKARLQNSLTRLAPQYGFRAGAFDSFTALLARDFTSLSTEEAKEIQAYFLKDYISQSAEGNVVVLASLKVPVGGSAAVHQALATDPDVFILDRQHLIKKFVTTLAEDFNQILYTSSLLVFVILLLFYGRIELALIAFIPMMVSWLWILGFMHLFDLHFNIVNIIISTFIFGLGDDYTIFMMDGLLGEYKDGRKNLPSYRISILLSALTTLFGMGILIFAKHPALRSIALVSVVGIGCVLFVAYSLIPLLFRGLISNRVKKGLAPFTFFSFFSTLLAFAWFLLGCLVLSLTGLLLFKIFRQRGRSVRLFYSTLITYFTRSLLYGVFTVKKNYINPTGEDLSKPAIIVANHQSFLDILVLLAAHPRILLFTNNWVWNSPFFGPVVRMAGFFNVSNGVENSLEMVRQSIQMGYSIAIFPEGSRSIDGQIRRFHKGAFFLAEQMNLDIIPVAIHGTAHCMPKHDFLLQPGTLTVKVLPRISPLDCTFGTTYQERTKGICHLMREEYALLRRETETPDYFYHSLVQKYIYKGPVLEWYLRVKIKLEKNYRMLHEWIPISGRVYDIGCGYGFLSSMLALTSADREVTGIDYDENKIKLAACSTSGTPNLSFFASDALQYPYESADAFVMTDVLHYLPKESQAALITRCVEKLNPGGILIIRDADFSLQKQHRGSRISEFFSVQLLRFNKSDNQQLHFISSQDMFDILQPLQVGVEIIHTNRFNSHITYLIKKRSDIDSALSLDIDQQKGLPNAIHR